MNKRIFRTSEAAEYVGLSASSLEKMRLRPGGPVSFRIAGGRAVGYDIRDLDAWLDAQRALEIVPTWARPAPNPTVVHLLQPCGKLYKTVCRRPDYFVRSCDRPISAVNCKACLKSTRWPLELAR